MIPWLNLVLPLLRLVLMFQEWARNKQMMDAGEDRAIAAAALKVLEHTQHGKFLREQVRALAEADEMDLWDRMLK